LTGRPSSRATAAARAKAGNAAAANAAEVGHLSERFADRAIEVIEGRPHGWEVS